MEQKIKQGDAVWTYGFILPDVWLIEGVVETILEEDSGRRVAELQTVYDDMFGLVRYRLDNVFNTREEAKEAALKQAEVNYKQIVQKIKEL